MWWKFLHSLRRRIDGWLRGWRLSGAALDRAKCDDTREHRPTDVTRQFS